VELKKPHRLRVVLLGLSFLFLFGVVGARLYYLQVDHYDYYHNKAKYQHLQKVVIQAERGDVLDRKGRSLAQNTGRMTVYIHPKWFREDKFDGDLDALIDDLTRILPEMDKETLEAKFAGRAPTLIARRVRSEISQRILDTISSHGARGEGFWPHRESIRLYPRHVAGPVLGFCEKGGDGDNEGLSGLELKYNEVLRGQKVVAYSMRTNIAQTLEPVEMEELLAARGDTLVLTLDANLQESVEGILAATVEEFHADAGGVVVMDVNTGGLYALASFPTYDNNDFSAAPTASRRNRPLTDPLETGSVVKLFTAGILLDLGYVTPETLIDCEGGYAVVDGRRLRDSPGHFLNVVTFREALRYSSNIGLVKSAQVLKNPEWYDYLTSFGFGAPTGVDLPGEGSGILYPLKKWTKFSRTSLPMGYEIALTPLQITAGISTLVNGGVYYQPHIVKEVRDPKGNLIESFPPISKGRILRPTTSAIMRSLMEDVVVNGTGKNARIDGYRIGGKTGTTRKSNVFDHREYIASFGGAFPINAPQVAIYVYIDNPKDAYYASQVAAPAFREVARSTALHLGIPPTDDAFSPEERFLALESQFQHEQQQDAAEISLFIGKTPNFGGMTMQEVRHALPSDLKKVRFLGTGVVADQYPIPGEPINKDSEIVLHFSPNGVLENSQSKLQQTAYYVERGGDG
jgi:cell division protein FtsI (penicillin-binding protein 3)